MRLKGKKESLARLELRYGGPRTTPKVYRLGQFNGQAFIVIRETSEISCNKRRSTVADGLTWGTDIFWKRPLVAQVKEQIRGGIVKLAFVKARPACNVPKRQNSGLGNIVT